jgi:uncharacterized protein
MKKLPFIGRRDKRQGLLADHPVENWTQCGGCDGECCRSFATVEITWQEYESLKTHGAIRLYFSLMGHHKLIIENGCEFLSQGRCSIYGDRPSVCRRFICQKPVFTPIDGPLSEPSAFGYNDPSRSSATGSLQARHR